VVGAEKLRQISAWCSATAISIIDQELEYGLRALAVRFGIPRKVVAALNVGVQAQRVSIQDLLTRFYITLSCSP